MRRLALLWVCSICWLAVSAGEPRDHFTPLKLGWSYHKAIDQGMSPLLYRGSAFAFSTGYFSQNDRSVLETNLDLHLGTISTRASNEGLTNRAYIGRAEIGVGYLRLVKSSETVRWFAGGHWANPFNFRGNLRLGNSAANYEFFSSLGASGAVQRDFEFNNRTVALTFRVRLPLFSYGLRPNYSGAFDINDQAEIQRDVFDNRKWLPIGAFTRINTRLMCSYPLKNGNLLQLGYEWDFYSYRPTHQVNAAMHSLVFSRTFKW